jgi:hypothetical protein
MGWAAANSAVKLSMFTFLLGLNCLFPGAEMKITSSGIQIAHRIGSSYGYFYLRNQWMEYKQSDSTQKNEKR